MSLATVAFISKTLLLGHLEGSSVWAIFLLWALRIVSLSLIFRTYIGPSLLRLVTDRLRVRSISLRSIRGIYFRAGSGTLRVDRVGISYHRPSSPLGSRFSIKVEGVRLELTCHNVEVLSKPASPSGGRTRRPIFAQLAPSPLASRAWALVSRLFHAIFTFLDPYLRPVFRKGFVTVIRLGIRALPTITHVLDFELDTATVTLSNIPGVVLEVKEATLQSKVALSLLESVIPVDHRAHRSLLGHKRFASVADWNTRFTNSVRRTWDRAWGATQVAASVSLQVRKVSGFASPTSLSGRLQAPFTDTRPFIDVPSFDFSVSVRVDPRQGVEPHSVETSFILDAVDLDFNVIQHLVSILKKPREAKVRCATPETTIPISPLSHPPSGRISWASPASPLSSRMTWTSAMSPNSPLREALSASMRFRWGGKQLPIRRVQSATSPSRLSVLKTVNLRLTKLSVRRSLPPTSNDTSQTFVVTFNDINLGAGLSHPDTSPLHREWLGSRSVPGDKLITDVYRLNFSTGLVGLDRVGSGTAMDSLQVFSTTNICLETIVTQWPLPWLKESTFLSGDPNAQLLAVDVAVGDIQLIEQLDVLQTLLSRAKVPAEKPRDARPLLPTILSPVPRVVFGLRVGRVRVCLISSSIEANDTLFALEAQTEGLVASANSRFLTVPDQRTRPIEHIEHDHVSVQVDFDLAVSTRCTFVNVCFGPDVGVEHRQGSTAGMSSLPGEALLSVDTIQVSGRGSAVGDMDELPSAVTIDIPSIYTDLHCWTDAISVELWHPDVVNAVAKVSGSLGGGSQKDSVKAIPRYVLDHLPFGLSASLSVGRFILFVTSPDLAPDEGLSLSRGVASHLGICVSYCAVHDRHFERVRDVLSRSQRRLQLSLPTEQILRAIARTAVPKVTSNVRALFHVALRDIVLRDAVATRFAADDPYFTADQSGDLKSREFLHIKNIDIEVTLSGHRPLELSHSVAKDECSVIATVSSVRGSLHLAQVYNLLLAARTIKFLASKPSPGSTQASPNSTLTLKFEGVVHEIQLLWKFPIRTKLSARVSSFNFSLSPNKTADIRWSTIVLAVSVPVEHDEIQQEEWEEFARLPDWRINVQPSVRPLSVVVDADSGRIRIPFNFVLADLILDINVTIKSIKHLARMVAVGQYEEPPIPEAEDAKNVPNILLRLRCMTVEAIDDDIESRLALIWRTASDAARVRQERDDAFQAKVTAIINANLPHATPTAHDATSDFQFSSDHTIPIDEARARLFQVHSVAWITGYRQAQVSQTSRQEEFLRQSNLSLHDTFKEDLVFVNPPRPVPPLFRLALDRLVLYLTAPALPSSSLPEFLHATGGGLPRDTQFSLLIPIHLNFTVTSLRLSYREYPLPLVNIPPSSAEATPGLEFDSDVVIAEEMGTAHSVEWVPCEIIKPNHGVHGASPLSLSIPKTIMPVKSYASPVIRVGTDDVTDFTWGVSYGPATQDLMRIMDTLSHASRDGSPPIGFWDKLRLVFHWRLKVTFEHEVHLHMKGSRNPYELSGHGAGFALCWRGSPQLLIGQENDEGELIQMISDSMLVVIPNVHDSSGDSVSAKHQPYSHNTDTLPFTNSHPRRQRRYRKICAKLSSGVRFGVGFVLERSCGPECSTCTGKPFDRQCRYFHFKPHYEVMLETKTSTPEIKSPEDSYNGFRSDFIHLSVSLVSAVHTQRHRQSPISSSLHLSPEVFGHFWAWWSLFDGALSLPIRQGPRYTRKRPRPVSPKFGQHLATLKYRISIARLFMSHAYTDQSNDAWIDGVTPYVGMKAFIDQFQVDMHQRDQESSHVTLGGVKTVHHKPFYAVEVVMKDMEMRAMLALFPDALKQQVSMEAPTFTGNYRTECKSDPVDPKSPWIDLDDFDRTEWALPAVPTVHLIPTVFCPRFTYFKRPKDDDKDNTPDRHVERTKFGGEDTHVCFLGKEASVTQVQIDLAIMRIKELQERLSQSSKAQNGSGRQGLPVPHSRSASEASEDIGDVPKMITLLENYISQLRAVEAASCPTGVNGHQSYYMPTDTVSPEEWAQFDNVYQIHSPQIFMDNTIRDILLQYYHLSRLRKGVEYHMAARAVKFIRDQAQAALTELLHDAEDTPGRVSGAQAAALAVRKLLGGDSDKNTFIDVVPASNQGISDSLNPLNGWSEGVHLRQSHFCLMLKPQIILRSEADANSVCILAAVQGKVKTFAIMDNANADDPVSGKVMSRNFVSVTGLQTFSPSAMNTSGEGYVPLEVLIDLRSENSAFDRLVPQTDATFQWDKFNRLRLRNNVTSAARTSEQSDNSHNHLRDQTDLIRVHVPRFTISANEKHFQAISSITTGLLLFTDAALKARSDKLEKMLFSYDFTNLASAADVVANMQSRLRDAVDTRREATWKLRGGGDSEMVEIFKIHAHILMLAEELNLVFDAIKLAQDRVNDDPDQKSSLLLHASSSEISWRMLDQQDQLIAKLAVRDIDFYWLSRHDSSTVNNLAVGDLQAFDGAADAQWTEILSKYDEPSTHPMVKSKLFLLADWKVLPPVGGITIYEAFELTFHPLRLQIDTRLGRKIMEYVWPARKNRKVTDEIQSFEPLAESPTTAKDDPMNTPNTPNTPSRASWDFPQRKSLDSTRLTATTPLRRLGSSRSFTDLRNARSDTLQVPKLHKTRSTDVLVPATPTNSSGGLSARSFTRTSSRKEADDAAEMKTRSSQKTFVWVKVSSLHLLLSIAKEDSFLCRDARIRTRDLEYRNQTLSFEELVDQFIPSGRNWRGWIKMAFQQPLVPVLPVAREIISKTKWINAKGYHHEEHNRPSTPRMLTLKNPRRDNSTDTRRPTLFTRQQTSNGDLITPNLTSEPDSETIPDLRSDGPSRLGRSRVLSVFKRKHGSGETRKSSDSESSMNSSSSQGEPRTDVAPRPRPRSRTTSGYEAGAHSSAMRSRRPSKVLEHIYSTRGIPPCQDDNASNPGRRWASTMGYRAQSGLLSFEGPQADVRVPTDDDEPGRIESALNLPPANMQNDFWGDDHHDDDIVEHLDVIDPQIATVSMLTNAANAIVIPPLSFYSRKPVVFLPRRPRASSKSAGDAEKGEATELPEDNLDFHVEDVLTKRDKFRRVMRGVWSFVKTPMGVVVAIYGFNVVFWGTALVFFLAKFIDLHNANTQGLWVEICQQVETALFSITSIGLIPFHVVDTYRICKIWHYQRRTTKLRRIAGLPALYDADDLPDPIYDANYVHVLTEQEQIDLHYQQHKFMESQTWYRPHGTQTHRAFPINIALWICILNDLNSFFQCILSGCMWSLNRFTRPAWTTATTLPAAFIAGILAGFYIYWGGRKTKRVHEVTERLRIALAMEHPAEHPSRPDSASRVPGEFTADSTPTMTSQKPRCKDFTESVGDSPSEERPSAIPISIADEMTVPPAAALADGAKNG
ncbi:golgi-body localization protein domain-containing protein [Amylocystis lapponica]|nr:golgi-body localization protein domain-containing protein [Amylocystis lapponica]